MQSHEERQFAMLLQCDSYRPPTNSVALRLVKIWFQEYDNLFEAYLLESDPDLKADLEEQLEDMQEQFRRFCQALIAYAEKYYHPLVAQKLRQVAFRRQLEASGGYLEGLDDRWH
jgi:hypothetical protein